MEENYYWILPYAKKLGKFFAADIQDEMKKDELYFPVGTIVRAIQYWIDKGKIIIFDTPCYTHSGTQKLHKYGYVEDEKNES